MKRDSVFSITVVSESSEPWFFTVKKVYFRVALVFVAAGLLAAFFFGANYFVMQSSLSEYEARIAETEKLNRSLGDLVTENYGKSFFDLNYKISFNKSGKLIVAGKVGAVDQNTGHKLFLSKFDGGKDLLWTKYFGKGSEESVVGVVYNYSNQIFVLSALLEFSGGGELHKKHRLYVFTDDGKLLKNEVLPLEGETFFFDLKNDSRGRLYLAGVFGNGAAGRPAEVSVKLIELDGVLRFTDFLKLQGQALSGSPLNQTERLAANYSSFAVAEKEIPADIRDEVKKRQAEEAARQAARSAEVKPASDSTPNSKANNPPAASDGKLASAAPKAKSDEAKTSRRLNGDSAKPKPQVRKPAVKSAKARAEKKPSAKPSEKKPSATKPSATKPSEKKPSATKPSEKKPSVKQPKRMKLRSARLKSGRSLNNLTLRQVPGKRIQVDFDLASRTPFDGAVYATVVFYNPDNKKYLFRPVESGVFDRRGILRNSLKSTKLKLSAKRMSYSNRMRIGGEGETYKFIKIFLYDAKGEETDVTRFNFKDDIFHF